MGPWLVGRLRDQSGSYEGGLLVIAAMVVVSAVAYAYAARRRKSPSACPPYKYAYAGSVRNSLKSSARIISSKSCIAR